MNSPLYQNMQYLNLIEDLSDAITHYGAKQVLEDLRILNLTNYEELVTMVMKTDGIKKKVAALLRDSSVNQD